jgi:XTP/dITP diphosphohydrolase
LEAPEEDEDTYLANARIKANYYGKHTGLPTLADDSGLEIIGLDGFPGVHTAPFAKECGGYGPAKEELERRLAARDPGFIIGTAIMPADFHSVLVLRWPDGHEEVVEALTRGHMQHHASGRMHFGFDPWFVPEGHTRTYAEMLEDEKNQISHRGKAMKELIDKCF